MIGSVWRGLIGRVLRRGQSWSKYYLGSEKWTALLHGEEEDGLDQGNIAAFQVFLVSCCLLAGPVFPTKLLMTTRGLSWRTAKLWNSASRTVLWQVSEHLPCFSGAHRSSLWKWKPWGFSHFLPSHGPVPVHHLASPSEHFKASLMLVFSVQLRGQLYSSGHNASPSRGFYIIFYMGFSI